jgi:hypothetical protein
MFVSLYSQLSVSADRNEKTRLIIVKRVLFVLVKIGKAVRQELANASGFDFFGF